MQFYPAFIKGLELNSGFYSDIVKPLLDAGFTGLKYSAALLGYGSDVLGYDTEISMDHNWGPRLQIFVDDEEIISDLDNFLKHELPFAYKGFPVNFSDPAYDKVQQMKHCDSKPINHLVEIKIPENYFKSRYGLNRLHGFGMDDWLCFTDQNLIEMTSGLVFHDGLGKINRLRSDLKFYPPDICKLRMAVLWNYIWNKEAFIGRSIALDDHIGLKINAARIVSYLLKILFYLEEKYIPYSKWFGTALKELKIFNDVENAVTNALNENEPRKIEENLCVLYEIVVARHNTHPGLPYIENKPRDFFNRPYRVIFAENIVEALVQSIGNEELRKTDLKQYALDIVIDF